MNDVAIITMLIPIVCTIVVGALIFGIRYFINREKMAMIERGISPFAEGKKKNYSTMLAFGLLFIGFGIGLFISFLLIDSVFHGISEAEATAVYFAMIFIFGGLGLVFSYLVAEKKTKKEQEPNY